MKYFKQLPVLMFTIFLLPAAISTAKTLKYTDHEPLGGMRTQFIKDVFFSAIEKESNGRLKIEPHWNGELSTSYLALSTVNKGDVADMAIVVPEYTANELPLHQIFKSFPVGPTGNKQLEFYRRVYADIPAFPEELSKQNVVNLFFATGYPLAFFSTKPLNTLDDIKGTRWRTASFWHQDFLRNAGATPVSMPWNDGIFQALQAGTLDGLMVNVDSGYQLNVHKTAPHVLISKELWLGHVYLLVMNKDTWNAMSGQDRQAIYRAANITEKQLGATLDKGLAALTATLEKEGAQFYLLSRGELEKWQRVTQYQAVQRDWVIQQESKGNADAGALMRDVSQLLEGSARKQP